MFVLTIIKQSFLHIFFWFIVLSKILYSSTAAQNIPLIDPKAENRQLPKSWDSILNDWKRSPSINWWNVILVFVFPVLGVALAILLIIFCVRFCKWFRARREALLLAMETRRIKRSRSRSHSISHKSSTEKPPKKDEDKFKKEDDNIAGKSLETAESRPELSIDIESKTTNGPPQIISGVHITESKSDKGDSLSLDVEFRPTKASEKSIGGNIQMFGSMRDNGGGGTFSGSGSLGSPSIVGDVPAVGSLRINMPSSLRKNEGSKKKEEVNKDEGK